MGKRNPMPPANAQAVIVRSGGLCERCGRQAHQIHHRRPRGMGGDPRPEIHHPTNLVHLCQPCHTWVETHRALAITQGWLVPRGVARPEEVPVWRCGGWWTVTATELVPVDLQPPF